MEEYSTPRAMKRVGDFFEKYKARLKAPQSTVERECVSVIKELTGFELKPSQVSYTFSTRTISIQAPSIIKTELRFKQQAILSELENRLGKDGCPVLIR
jgi:hypothetical protein